VKFHVLTAASMKIAVFWDVAPCSLVQVYRRFRGVYYLHHQGDKTSLFTHRLMVEAVSTSETSVNFYYTTLRNIPEDGLLHHFYLSMLFTNFTFKNESMPL
jgi:hypothetical protein